jgi:molybdopterin-guanine dinucleotide biosynthesis protein A
MSCAGVVLTGGASRRMGKDKASLPLRDGTTMAVITAGLLRPHTSPCIELGPGVSGLPAVPDAGHGPLAALAGARAFWDSIPAGSDVVVLATDLPRLTSGLVAWLVGHPAGRAVVPLDNGRRQPLCARYPVEALRDHTVAALGTGARSLAAWLATIDVHEAGIDEWAGPAGDPLALRDADTPADLAALRGPA